MCEMLDAFNRVLVTELATFALAAMVLQSVLPLSSHNANQLFGCAEPVLGSWWSRYQGHPMFSFQRSTEQQRGARHTVFASGICEHLKNPHIAHPLHRARMRTSPPMETQFASGHTKGSEHIWWGCEPPCPWHAEQLFMGITVWHRGTRAMHTIDYDEYMIAAVQHDT
jgi:hypothetical protein